MTIRRSEVTIRKARTTMRGAMDNKGREEITIDVINDNKQKRNDNKGLKMT